MVYAPSTPPQDEHAALSELGRIEAVVRATPTTRVRARALCVLGRLLCAPEVEQAGRNLEAIIDEYHAAAREHGELTDEEIDAEIRASRRERRQAGSPLRQALDAIREQIRGSGQPVPTLDEIEAEIEAVREQRRGQAMDRLLREYGANELSDEHMAALRAQAVEQKWKR